MIPAIKKTSIAFFWGVTVLFTACTGGSDRSDPDQNERHETARYDSLRHVLEAVYDTDQGIREKLMAAEGAEFGRLVQQMQQIDSSNQEKVNRILSDFGWLSQSQVGEKASDAIFFVVQHAGIDVIKEHYPTLKALAKENEAKATHAAMMEDRLLMYEGKKQIYGTQASSDTSGSFYIWPIKDPGQVNALRKKMGFERTVEKNAERLGAIYDPERKLEANQ